MVEVGGSRRADAGPAGKERRRCGEPNAGVRGERAYRRTGLVVGKRSRFVLLLGRGGEIFGEFWCRGPKRGKIKLVRGFPMRKF